MSVNSYTPKGLTPLEKLHLQGSTSSGAPVSPPPAAGGYLDLPIISDQLDTGSLGVVFPVGGSISSDLVGNVHTLAIQAQGGLFISANEHWILRNTSLLEGIQQDYDLVPLVGTGPVWDLAVIGYYKGLLGASAMVYALHDIVYQAAPDNLSEINLKPDTVPAGWFIDQFEVYSVTGAGAETHTGTLYRERRLIPNQVSRFEYKDHWMLYEDYVFPQSPRRTRLRFVAPSTPGRYQGLRQFLTAMRTLRGNLAPSAWYYADVPMYAYGTLPPTP